jgi:hypothetical protein
MNILTLLCNYIIDFIIIVNPWLYLYVSGNPFNNIYKYFMNELNNELNVYVDVIFILFTYQSKSLIIELYTQLYWKIRYIIHRIFINKFKSFEHYFANQNYDFKIDIINENSNESIVMIDSASQNSY